MAYADPSKPPPGYSVVDDAPPPPPGYSLVDAKAEAPKAPAAPPKPAKTPPEPLIKPAMALAGKAVRRYGGEYMDAMAKRSQDARKALGGDLTDQRGWRSPLWTGLKTAGDLAGYALAPVMAIGDVVVGYPAATVVNKVAGTHYSPQDMTDALSVLIPGGGEKKALDVIREASPVEATMAAVGGKAGKVTRAKQAAAHRLLTQGKLDPAKIIAKAEEARKVGAPEPTILGAMDMPGQRVVRASGAKMGDADNILETHRTSTREDIAAQGAQRAAQLKPRPEPIKQRIEDLENQREDLAQGQYRAPYAQPIKMDERLFEVLNVPEIDGAINGAQKAARLRMLDRAESARVEQELGSIKQYRRDRAAYEHDLSEWETGPKGEFGTQPSPDTQVYLDNPRIPDSVKQAIREAHGWREIPKPTPPEMPTLSGASLDRLRIQLGNRAQAAYKAKAGDVASGFNIRRGGLDEYLDSVPHLEEARASYHDYSERIRQAEYQGDIAVQNPAEFKRELDKLTPQQLQERRQAVAQILETKFGKSSRGEQSAADIIITGHNAAQNLRALFGARVADDYMRAIDIINKEVRNATFASSRVGAQTANVAEDIAKTAAHVALHTVTGRPHLVVFHLGRFLDRNFTGLQEAEATAIAEWAVSHEKVEDTLAEIVAAAQGKKSSLPPDLAGMVRGKLRSAVPVAGVSDTVNNAQPQGQPQQ